MLRTARERDVEAVREIHGHHVRHGVASFELEPPDIEEMTRRMAAAGARGLPYVVAELEGTITGFAALGPYRPRPAYRWTVEDTVYVAPHALGRGIGRALLDELIDRAESAGYRQMIAVIGDSGNAASIALHAGAGFARVGVLTDIGFEHGRWLDSVLMQRALGPGAATPPECV
jgi:phosphinothricin acetyltransferase